MPATCFAPHAFSCGASAARRFSLASRLVARSAQSGSASASSAKSARRLAALAASAYWRLAQLSQPAGGSLRQRHQRTFAQPVAAALQRSASAAALLICNSATSQPSSCIGGVSAMALAMAKRQQAATEKPINNWRYHRGV